MPSNRELWVGMAFFALAAGALVLFRRPFDFVGWVSLAACVAFVGGEQSRIEPNVGQFDVVVRFRRDAIDTEGERLDVSGRLSIRTRTSEIFRSEVFSTTTSRITGTAFSWYARLTCSVTEHVIWIASDTASPFVLSWIA